MRKWLMGLIFVSAMAWASECQTPTGNTVPDGAVQVGITDSLSVKYAAIRDFLVAAYGENGFQNQAAEFVVQVEGCFDPLCLISDVYPMRLSKHCSESIRQAANKLVAQYAEGGGGGGAYKDPTGGNGDPSDPLSGCYVWPGGVATTDNGEGGGVTEEFFPSELVCP